MAVNIYSVFRTLEGYKGWMVYSVLLPIAIVSSTWLAGLFSSVKMHLFLVFNFPGLFMCF